MEQWAVQLKELEGFYQPTFIAAVVKDVDAWMTRIFSSEEKVYVRAVANSEGDPTRGELHFIHWAPYVARANVPPRYIADLYYKTMFTTFYTESVKRAAERAELRIAKNLNGHKPGEITTSFSETPNQFLGECDGCHKARLAHGGRMRVGWTRDGPVRLCDEDCAQCRVTCRIYTPSTTPVDDVK